MEPIPQTKNLLTKISLFSNIIPYYGYIHECAELFSQLSKECRDQWESNIGPILKVIMKHNQCKMIMKINKVNRKLTNYLLKGSKQGKVQGIYNYFSIKVNIESSSAYGVMIKLLKEIKKINDELGISVNDVFCKIFCKSTPVLYSSLLKFVKEYVDLGFNKEALDIDRENLFSCLENYKPRGKQTNVLEYLDVFNGFNQVYRKFNIPSDQIQEIKHLDLNYPNFYWKQGARAQSYHDILSVIKKFKEITLNFSQIQNILKELELINTIFESWDTLRIDLEILHNGMFDHIGDLSKIVDLSKIGELSKYFPNVRNIIFFNPECLPFLLERNFFTPENEEQKEKFSQLSNSILMEKEELYFDTLFDFNAKDVTIVLNVKNKSGHYKTIKAKEVNIKCSGDAFFKIDNTLIITKAADIVHIKDFKEIETSHNLSEIFSTLKNKYPCFAILGFKENIIK